MRCSSSSSFSFFLLLSSPSSPSLKNPVKTPLLSLLSHPSSSSAAFNRSTAPPTPLWRRSSSIFPPPRTMAIPPKLMSSTSILSSASSLGNISSEHGLAAKLWIKFRRELHFAMYSPFIVCLASGKLEIDSFRHFVAQDFHFLKAFAHAYELAEECADDDEAKLAIADLRKAVVEGLKKHNSVVMEWGIDPAKEVSADPATVKYTDFLLATASGKVEGVKGPGKLATPFERTKIAAYILGAVAPCMRLYAFLGKELQELVDSNDDSHPYKKWIEDYSCDKFQVSAFQTEDLLEKLSVCLTGEELDVIEKLYHQGMKHETEFFNAQSLGQPTVVPLTKVHNPDEDRLVIFSDFDLTCTVVDSSAILAEIAIVTAPKSDLPQSENQIVRMSSAELRNTWGLISTQYTEEYEQCIESILPPEKVEFNFEALCKALEQLSVFERRANSRVIKSGVLKGLNLEDIKRAGERLLLQDGCSSFFQKITGNEKLNLKVNVLSYCWCADLIRSAFSSGGLGDVSVNANELTFEESISTGEIINNLESPMDKAEAFRNILKVQKEMHDSFVWLFQQVFSHTPTLMVSVMILLANFTVYSMGTQYAIATVPTTTVRVSVLDNTEHKNTKKFHSSVVKTFPLMSSPKPVGEINGGGGGNIRPVGSGTEEDGSIHDSDELRTIVPDDALELSALGTGQEAEQVNEEDASKLWNRIVDEASNIQGTVKIDEEVIKRLVSPIEARIESEDNYGDDYLQTELLYLKAVGEEPNNPLLLANYAQFLYLISHDYDRAEEYFKRAVGTEQADAEALSKYATFLWKVRNDEAAAEETFLEAMAVNPDSAYFPATYAAFLWKTGGEDTCFPLGSLDTTQQV